MSLSKRRKKRMVSLACLLVLAWTLLITGTAFAEGDVPSDAPDNGTTPAQTEVTADSEQTDDVEETEPAAEESSTVESGTSEEGQDTSSQEETSGEDDVEESPAAEEQPAEDEAEEQTDEDASQQAEEPAEEDSDTDEVENEEVVNEDAQTEEDDGVPSGEEDEETSDTEETPDEAVVEIVDEEGETLDMASEEDTELVSSGDPYWSVGRQYYSVVESEGDCYPGTSVAEGTCWLSSTPIATALEKIENDGLLPSDRKLYVMAGEYNGDLNFNGYFLNQMNGLIGVDGSTSTIINGDVTVAYNTGGFTLSGFTINGSVEMTDTAGNLVLEDLNVSNDSGDGIKVYNKEWYYYNEGTGLYEQGDGPKYTGTVKLENVNSSNNLGMGAHIWTMSNITVNNSSFNKNGGTDGVDDPVDSLVLDNSWGTGSVYMSGVSASNNNGTGILVQTGRNAKLEGITASLNTAPSYEADPGEYDYGFGLYLRGNTGKMDLDYIFTIGNEFDGTYVDGYKATILMDNINASANGAYGIEIYTQGALTINIAETDGNGLDGILAMVGRTVKLSSIKSLGNNNKGLNIIPYPIWEYDEDLEEYVLTGYMGPTSVTLNSPKYGGAAMANNFSGNGDEGVYIRAKGTVTLTNLDVYENGKGIYVENELYDEDSDRYFGKGNVTINVTIDGWYNGVGNNTDKGIEIHSLGVVKIYETSAMDNTSDGIYVDAQNTIMLTDVSAHSNGSCGAFLTTLSSPKGRTVTITDSYFEGNSDTGIMVLTAGTINFRGSSASGNSSPNMGGPLSFPISIHDVVYSTDATESWGFYGYDGDALSILLESDDFDFTVTLYDSLNNVIADNSGSAGSSADFSVVLGADDWYRIEVGQSGMIGTYGQYTLSVNDVDHEHNIYPGSGAILDNSAGTKSKVVISTTRYNPQNVFDDNHNYGLKIDSNGSVVIVGATASHNYTGGLYVVNPDSTGSVVLQDKSSEPISKFDGNGLIGINIQTQGTISIYGVASASYNGDAGVILVNSFYDSETGTYIGRGSVTFNMRKNTMSSIEGNNVHGLGVLSNGTINVTNVIANDNGGVGAILDNYSGNGSVNVRTSGTNVVNEFSRNGWNDDISYNHGLYVISRGNISVKDSNANENYDQGAGMLLRNEDAESSRKVQVSGGEVLSNSGYGLQIESKGAVSVMKFVANQNGWNGIDVDACQEDGGVCQGNGYLKLSEVNADENGGVGIQAHAMSTINLSKVYANSNGDKGIRLDNQFEGSNASVILVNVGASENNNTGILINTNGAVTMRGIQADGNMLRSGFLNDGDAVHDYYNYNDSDDEGADRWYFEAESGVELILRLAPGVTSMDGGFAGMLELYDEYGSPISSGYTVIGDGTWTGIQWTPTETGAYYVLVTENNQESDFYQISLNNETYDDMAFYYVDGVAIIAGKNVTLTGSTNSSFSGNSVTGMFIETPAHISLRCLEANGNGTEGVTMNNFLADEFGDPTGYGKVSVMGRNSKLHSTFNGNGWQGLKIRSNSVVTLQYLDAFNNGQEGIRLGETDKPEEEYNSEDYIGGKVSAKYLRVYQNGGDGLQINSLQNVTLTSISANENGDDGVYVITRYGTGGVSVNGNNYFWGNGARGIGAISNEGDVRLYGIDARSNGSWGIVGGSMLGRASIDRSLVQQSGVGGIMLGSGENISVNRVTSMVNGYDSDGDGIFIQALAATPISIKSSIFMGNGGNGIEVAFMDSMGPWPVLSKTLYFGNDVDYDGTIEEANIYVHVPVP